MKCYHIVKKNVEGFGNLPCMPAHNYSKLFELDGYPTLHGDDTDRIVGDKYEANRI